MNPYEASFFPATVTPWNRLPAPVVSVTAPSLDGFKGTVTVQRRRAIEALEARAPPPPQYCDCGPDWPLLFKVHEI